MNSLLAFALLASPNPPTKGWPLLDDNSKRAVRFFVEQSPKATGFTKDRARNFTGDYEGHVVASIAAIGFSLAAHGVAYRRGWMPKAEALAYSRNVVRQLKAKAPQYRGWYSHWINAQTGAREWNSEYSTIDSAILWSGLIVAERALRDRELTQLTNEMLAEVNWRDMLTDGGAKPNELTIGHGWRPNEGYLNSRWRDVSENMMLSVLALGADPQFPAKTWDALERKRVTEYGMETLTGGPLFMHQMSHIFIDFRGKRDRLGYDYWVSSRNQTLIQREYGRRNPKGFKNYSENLWGLSACDIPGGYNANGFPVWGGDDGTLAAPAAIASVMFTPKESIAAAEAFLATYPKGYGRYGFSSGINGSKDWIGPDVIGIDQGQMLLAIEAARDGLPQRLFMSHPMVKRGLERIGLRTTKEGPVERRKLYIQPR